MGDFNTGLDNAVLKDFCNLYNVANLINKATCYKNPNNPSCIDLLPTNFPKCFQNSCVMETGLSDFLNPIQDGEGCKRPPPPPYHFFPCNFYERRN